MRGRLHASPPPRRLWPDDRGATAVEYALMASAIAGVIVVIVFTLGTQVADLFQRATTWP
jgi:Flp pilus assembly pilin Flp